MAENIHVHLTQKEGYQFMVDFGEGFAQLLADEPSPVGHDKGPAPSHMLVAAAANCLAASLFFAMQKYRQNAGRITADATCTIGRNAENRQRVTGIDVTLNLGEQAERIEHLDRILGQFEPFCTVSQSIEAGVPIKVTVKDMAGQVLKGA